VKRPYRLATRAVLSPEPPFSPEMVRALILDSLRGPKRGYAKHGEPSADEMMYLSSTLNNRPFSMPPNGTAPARIGATGPWS
jgi:hypothetical protein